jgi:hypothetical protein
MTQGVNSKTYFQYSYLVGRVLKESSSFRHQSYGPRFKKFYKLQNNTMSNGMNDRADEPLSLAIVKVIHKVTNNNMSKCVENYDELNMKIIEIEHSSNSGEVAEAMKIVVEKNKSFPS